VKWIAPALIFYFPPHLEPLMSMSDFQIARFLDRHARKNWPRPDLYNKLLLKGL
jgi:hypothetical protein